MSTLTLLRHGQASFGAERYDALSDRGREQSQLVGEHFAARGRRFDRVWIGPRDRHRLTARHALELLGMDWQSDAEPALNEFAEGQQILGSAQQRRGVKLRGDGDGAVRGKDAARYYAQEITAWAESQVAIEGVPHVHEFRTTVSEWLARATASTLPGQSVLAVTSGGVIAAVMTDVLGLADASIGVLMHALYNGSLTELIFSEGRSPSLVSFNVASFLPDELLTRV